MSMTIFDTATMAGMMEGAIAFCAEKTGLRDREQIMEALRRGDCSICEYLRHGLSKEVAGYLASVDGTVRAIYTYEPEYATSLDAPIPDRPGLSPSINLIVWVNRKTAALSSVANSVSSALAQEFQRIACPKADALCHTLDVKMADDAEVQGRTGYGALVNSLYVQPMEIWHR
jgi:hypothetical protein